MVVGGGGGGRVGSSKVGERIALCRVLRRLWRLMLMWYGRFQKGG